ncbi:MAG: hypothetical protein R3B89_35445 [Polyangiaceae bacterium]
MTDEEFVRAIRLGMIDENAALYEESLRTTNSSEVTDESFALVQNLFQRLSGEDQKTLLLLVRLAMVDTVSNIFGLLDGVCTVDGVPDLVLSDAAGQKLSGDLQDHFLAQEEEERG